MCMTVALETKVSMRLWQCHDKTFFARDNVHDVLILPLPSNISLRESGLLPRGQTFVLDPLDMQSCPGVPVAIHPYHSRLSHAW